MPHRWRRGACPKKSFRILESKLYKMTPNGLSGPGSLQSTKPFVRTSFPSLFTSFFAGHWSQSYVRPRTDKETETKGHHNVEGVNNPNSLRFWKLTVDNCQIVMGRLLCLGPFHNKSQGRVSTIWVHYLASRTTTGPHLETLTPSFLYLFVICKWLSPMTYVRENRRWSDS